MDQLVQSEGMRITGIPKARDQRPFFVFNQAKTFVHTTTYIPGK
jgi:hypothetical protein